MGFKIHTAIGWGMPIDDFIRHLALPDIPDHRAQDWMEVLEERLAGTSDMRGPRGWPLPVTGPGDTVYDLIAFIGYDEFSDVILFPSIGEARDWKRVNDDLDYAFHWGPRGSDDHETPCDRVEYLVQGFHPYGSLRMTTDGTPVEAPPRSDDDAYQEWERNPDLVPGLPVSLRHWLSVVNLLDAGGIARLRPVRAIWWS